MQLASSIFNEMVMQEAIKDKTEQVQNEMMEQMANEYIEQGHQEEYKDEQDSDSDFDDDDASLRNLRDARIAELKRAH